MSSFDYSGWREAARRQAAQVASRFLDRHGYPPGDQVIDGPTDKAVIDEALQLQGGVLPGVLVDFYREVGRVSLPDVGPGYFVSPLERVLSGLDGIDPVRIVGRWEAPVVVFGSSGGGTLFAVGSPTGTPVYALPPGAVHDQVYEDTMEPARIVADSLPMFLIGLLDAVDRFLSADR